MAGSPPSSPGRSSRVLSFPTGHFYIQSGIAGLVLDIESGFLKDPLKAGARVELAHRKSSKSSIDVLPQLEQQLWRAEEGYIVNVRTGHVLDIQGGVVRAGSRVIQNVRKTGKDAAGQQWLNDDGVFTLASNPKFVITIDGDATRDGTRITIQEKKVYNEKQKWYYLGGGGSNPVSPSPSRAESISIRPDNFPTSWFYIKSAASGLVVDIEHGYFTDPMKAGARAEMNHQKIDNGDGRHSLLELQLWRYEAGFLINRRTGFVLDIQGGTLKLAARVVQWQRKTGKDARNQHWFYENGFIANVYNSRLVLDIDGDGSKDGAKIAVGERKAVANNDQKWLLEEARFTWLEVPSTSVVEEVVSRELPASVTTTTITTTSTTSFPTTTVLPTTGWFYIKSQSSGYVIDVEQGLLSDPMAPNVLVNMNAQITTDAEEQREKLESQLWCYIEGQLINRRSGLVLDCKQGVVRYGARLMQGVAKQGKEAHHQRWEAVNGCLVIQGKPTFAIDIEGDGSKMNSRLSLQRPKSQNNLDQQWVFQLASFEFLQHDRDIIRTVTERVSKVVAIKNDDWFFIKSGATGYVMDLEAGWITSPTDPGAYISMKKQRSLDDADKSLLERQLWRYEDGYFINRRTNYVIDIYGRSAIVGVKLIQQHKATTEEDGKHNQLWNVVDGNIQLVYNPKLVITAESNKDNSRVQLVELKSMQANVKTWTLELAQSSWLKHSRIASRSSSYDEGLEEAQIAIHTEFPSEKYFYIKSRASGLVLDVEHGFLRDHTKPGSCVELNNQKLYASAKRHALLELQLWCYKDGYIINRRTGLVLDVYQGSLKSGSRIIQWTQKSESNENQLWAVSNGFIHLKSQPNLVLDVDGDGTRDGARIALNDRKDKKNLDQRWTFEAVQFTWLSIQRSYSTVEDDVELLKEFEANNLARVVEHRHAPVNCWFYLKSGVSDLVLEVEHGRQINHLKAGTHLHLAHQRLKAGKHSHALLELQLWRFDDGYIINRRSGLVLGVDQIEANAQLIQTTKTGADTQRWVIEEGVIRLASRQDFAIFFSYGHQGSRAYIRHVRQGEHVQSWSCAEVHFSWLTLDYTVTETLAEEEKLDVSGESEISYLKKEQVVSRKLEKFSHSAYFFIRTSNGHVVDIDHGFNKNHMKVGAYASIHPQTTAASANQHAMLDIQLWTLKDGYLINKRTGLALTLEGDAKEGARLIQVLPKDAIKWAIEAGFIFPEQHSHLALNIRDGYVVVVERTTAVTWSVYEVTLSWLVWTEITLIEEERYEDFEFYEEFEEVVLRSSATSNEVIQYAETVQHLVAPKESWFYLVAGNRVASITASHILERGADGAHIHLVVQKRFSSAERHSLVELQLWRLEGSYVINRFTGLYLTVDSTGALIMTSKQADASRQQWQFSEDGSFSLISNPSQVVDFVNDKAVLVERSSSKTIWLYDAVRFNWLTTSEVSTSYDVKQIEREVTEYKTVYTRYITYLTKYTVITTTTTITRTRRIVRVHTMCPLENATVLEREGTVWACHLKEAGTGVDYVMQLLLDNTTNVYYIYVQWGSTEGQLEGPYETTEQATREFQEIFSSKVGIEWTERETTVTSGENWSAVEFEYDTVTIESERSGVPVPKRSASTTSVSAAKFIDHACPIADQATVYSDEDSEVYHVSLSRKTTGEIYTTQLLFNYVESTYYVYLRWGEDQVVLDGPYETAEEAKVIFKTKYTEAYSVTWEERRTVTNTQWSIVHHEFGTEEEFVDYESEEEETTDKFVAREQQHITVHDDATNETTTTTTITNKVLVVNQPAVTKETSWFRRFAAGAGVAVAGALINVNGVWKRTSQVLTTRKAHVDAVCPMAKTSYVYYDNEVYDSVLTEKSTGITYVTQLIYNSETNVYYVYYRWGETDYKLDGPHETIESAKEAFQVTYKEKFDVEWTERETTTSEKWTYEFKTYEEFETIEEIEEVYDESEAQVIIAREKEIAVDDTKVHEHTTTTVTHEEVTVEHETTEETVVIEEEHRPVTKVVVSKETGVVTQPAVTKETSWFRTIASGAGGAAVGALTKVDGIWKRTVQVFNTRKAKVDHVCPIAETAIVYYDEDVYDSVLTEKSTGITYVTQLIFDSQTNVYYVYYRWGETEYKMDGPHKTIESAKEAFQVTYKEKFDVEWTTRETTASEKWTYEFKTYETYEEIEEIEEVVDETEAQVIIAREQDITKDDITTRSKDTTTTTTTVDGAVSVEHVSTEVVVDQEETTVEEAKNEEVKEVVVTKTTSTLTQPAVPEKASWFRRVLGSGAAVGAVAAGAAVVAGAVALNKVDGVWKRTVQVLTTRKAKVDHVCPLAKTAYVYYDEEVYDSVLTEKSTGITYVTQLIFDSQTNVYYVYYRWGETDYKLDGPHEAIESAKEAFQVTYKEKFDVEWTERETTTSEKWTYEVKTYETFEEIEEVEEIIEETEAEIIIAREKAAEVEGTTIHEETKTTITEEVVAVEHESKEETVVVEEDKETVKEVIVTKETGEVTKPAVSTTTSWFRRALNGAETAALGAGALVVGAGVVAAGVAAGAAHGAGNAASGALHKVDGVWKRTVQVLTTRKAKVDHVCPLSKTAYVYYDDEVYDSVLTEKSTGITYVTQLIFDSQTNVYYVYYRWGETDYKLDGPHETIESAKEAFQVTYKEKFDVEWIERETTTSEKWTYEVKTYETFEEIEEVEEIIEETEAEIIIAREKEIEVEETKITEATTTTVTEEEVAVEHVTKETVLVEETEEQEAIKEVVIQKETGVVAKPAVPEKASWFRRALTGVGATVVGAGAIAAGAASGAGQAASGALTKVDGVWKRTVQVLTTRKAKVDHVCPLSKTAYVYYDDEVYDSVLTEKSTGITYVTQLIFDSQTNVYYVYYRWGETDYKLDGPHETIESAKEAFQVTYKEKFDVEWIERETTTSEKWTYEVKTYETFEEIEEVEEIIEETEAEIIIAREKEIEVEETKITEATTTTVTEEEVTVEHVTKETVLVEETEEQEAIKEVVIQKETGVVAKPAVPEKASWFRRALTGVGATVVGAGAIAAGAAHGAGQAASGALHKVDGVWKRTVQVLTTRKAKVDHVCPLSKTAYVYYDDEVYDSVLTEKSTGITYVTQLIFDSQTNVYYVYYRWGETEYKLDGPHETIESAKEAFQVTYKEKFDVEWAERETTTSEKWTYEVKTYETFEEIEEVDEIIEETEAEIIIAREKEIEVEETKITEATTTTVTEEEVTVEHVTKETVLVEETEEQEAIKEVVIQKETGVVAKPAVPEKASWFRRALTGVGATVVGAGAIAAGAASGAGQAASGALTKVDGVWKRTVQVLTTRKAKVDHVCPLSKTAYVYYDDEVYDSVLTEKSTGITYVTQLIFDSQTNVYYVYYRWGETDYKLDGPHETIESAKEAFQVTYKEKFDVEWIERETTTSEKWTYEVKTYETFEEIEEVEEIIEETEAEIIIAREKEIEVEETKITEATTTTVTEEEVAVEHVTKETVLVEETEEQEAIKEVVIQKETGVVAKPAVPEKASWFRRALTGVGATVVGAGAIAAGAAHGAGQAASGALHKVDGVWKRTVQVLTTRKAKVDHVCPLSKTAYVYYDDEVYDSVLTEKSTGITYVTQLIFDSQTNVYYVYYRWGETEYKLDGPHETIESAKEAFQVTYKEKFDVEWAERETTTSEKWTYEVKTYETFEEIEEVDEIIEETEAEIIIAREKEIEVEETKITEATTTTVTEEEVTVEHVTKETVLVEETEEQEAIKEVVIQKETGVVAKPAVPEKASWFRRALTGVGATVVGAGAIAAGAASGAGQAASGALTKVDGVWKRTVQVLTTRKAKVDHVCPLSKTAYVYYDDEVYDSVLTEKSTGITYVTQLIFDSQTNVYYVYYRWGETDYKLDGPHETIESAKEAFQVTYKEKFDVEWIERETTTSEKWTYEVKTYETFEEIEEVEEIIEETEAEIIIAREKEIEVEETKITEATTTTVTEEEVTVEHVTKETVLVEETEEQEAIKEVVIQKETGVVAKPAVPEKASWFRRALTGVGATVVGAGAIAAGAAHGAGQAASGALHKVDGVWKRTVQVLTTRKAKVDHVCPLSKTAYVYYDDEVYDSVLTEKSTGITYVTQLIFDSQTNVYYVYYRWGETEYKLDGPHETIESAKEAFQVTYKEKFDVEWTERETTTSEKWTYEVKTYETFEEIEEIEEIVEETEVQTIIAREQSEHTDTNETTQTTESITESGEIVVVEETKKEVVIKKDDVVVVEEMAVVDEEKEVVVEKKEVAVEKTTAVVDDKEEVVVEETEETTVEETEEITVEETVKEVVITKETGKVAKPAVPEKSSWFRRALSGAEAAALGAGALVVGAGAVAVGVAAGAAHGAGHAASGALHKVDGVWKRTVQVLTTRKAKVDHVCPIAKTAYVYYDDEVYDSVLTERSTGITYVTQLIFDSETKVYYVYYRWGETEYKLEGPHETIESAKEAFQVTYKEKFDVEWTERETTTSEKWTYEVKTYETFEEIEEVEEIIEETEAEIIIAREKEIEVEETKITEATATTVTEEVVTVEHETIKETVVVEEETETVKEVITEKETGEVAQPAVEKSTSWFRRALSGAEAAALGAGALVVGAGAVAVGVAAGAAHGAGNAATGALEKVDGVWKRTVQVLTTRKAHVDHVCPIAKTSYVYYDDEVYDSVLTEKSTGITYVTQLIFDSETKVYYVYYRWGETDYKLDGPHETIESAKEAFQVTYKEKFDVEWTERETTTSERWIYEVKTYETFEEVEEVEEIIEETEAEIIIAREKEIEVDNTKITEATATTVTEEVVTVEHETIKETVAVEQETETVKEVIVEKETGEVAQPAVEKSTSWFRRALSGAEAAALGAGALVVGAGAVAVGVAAGAAHGAGNAATGALEKVDGVWKRTVQVLTTRKAKVDHVCPIAKTAYVYYDDEVYDSVLTEKSTGITYVTQLIFDSETKVYYVYYRWGETEYKLEGPHKTIESAKEAFQVTYKEKFDVEWKERETATSERWIYEVKTYETFEEIEEVEEIIEETEAEIIIAREKEIEVEETKITEATATTVTEEVVTVEHETIKETVVVEEETETVKEVITEKETGEVAQPAVEKSTSWFRRALSGAEAAALGAGALVVGAGAVAVGVAAGAAHGAGHAANGALEKVDGVWKRTVQVLTTRKAKVDHVCPIAKTAYVYYDDEVYDSVLTEKSTGITYVTQLIFDSETKVYYVYYRWGETDYKLDGPHKTIESAKEAFQVTYKEKFDVEWKERETATSERWIYEVKTYETFEEVEEVEEIVEETEAEIIIAREKEIEVDNTTKITEETTTTVTEEVVSVEHETTKETVVVDEKTETVKEIITEKETGEVTQPAVPQKTSWFRRALSGAEAAALGAGALVVGAGAVAVGVAAGAAHGAGHAANGALEKVDGVWKRTVQVLTTRKAHVDHVCPIAKTSYVYYDDEVYDSVLTEKSTGITYVTQLIFDSETKVYYVYYRWGETDYKLDGPHETIESAKEAFQVTYKEKFDVEWTERETTTSEKWTYEVKTYETFEEIEEVEEIIEECEAEIIIAREKEIEVDNTKITEETTTTVTEEVVTVEHETTKETVVVVQETETVKEVIVEKETGEVAQPAVEKSTSWFRRALSGAEAAALGAGALVVGAGAVAVGVAAGAAHGAGHAANGALEKVDGVWKRTVQVLTTRKAKVDHVCPIAKTAYVYYDDEVYDSVLTEKSTGITYVTQLIFDSETKVYYVYYRWGETDYKLDGPHKTIESAKEAFQVTYKEKFDVEWKERETATSERWIYEVKTYETFEEVEEVEEIVEETEAEIIIAREKEIEVDNTTKITEETTTTVTEEVVSVEHETTKETVVVDEKTETVKEIITEKETGEVTQPAVPQKTSWFRRALSGAEAAALGAGALVVGAGAVAVGVAAGAAHGAGHAANGALEKVDGVWKRTVQVLTTRKAHVDHVCPIAKTSYVYYDDEVYDSVLTEKSTGITYVTQLIFDSETKVYYVYYRWGETDYKLDGPHETIESAKEAFQVTYKKKFDVEWTERETTTSEKWTYEVKTYETFEEVEEIEEIVEETQAELIIAREKEIEVDNTKITEETTTIVTEEEVTVEHVTKETVVVEQTEEQEEAFKEVVIKKETGVVAKPAVPEKASWFRRALTGVGATVVGAGAIAAGAASGAGQAASGALTKVDGVWKRTVQVLTTRKAKVDHVCPLSKTAYVYYDDEVYDSVLTEKSTGITYVTQLIFDSQTNVYYVYYRWGETEYKLDGPHETIESAKEAFQVTYKEKFDVEWKERETTTSERWTYEVKTYETFEEIEEVEEIVEETEVQTIIAREQSEHTDTTETTQTTETITESGEVVLEHVTKEVVVVEETEKEVVIKKDDVVVVEEKAVVDEEKEIIVEKKEVAVEKTKVVVDDKEEVVIEETEETTVEETEEITVEETVKEVVITKETGKVAKPAVPEKSSWFRRALSGAEAAALGAGALVVGAGAVAVGVAAGAAHGAGHAASGALHKVDGVWKRTVQVLTTRKAKVDHVCPIAKTAYVYYDDEVYDSVLTEKSTGITYVTQLIFDSETKVYYVYYRWGETDYKLDGPHETIESAKKAFQVTYKEKFDVEWKERETTTSERWIYEVKTYETFEEVEEIEEVIEETEAEIIIAREKEIEVDNTKITEETTTTVTEEVVTVEHETTKEIVVVEQETETVKEVIVEKETGEVAQPAVEKSTSWFRRALSGAEAAALGAGALVVGAGAVAVGVAAGAAHGAGHAANGALEKVDGVWKRTVQVLTTRKAKVDHVCPIAKTAYVYYDDEVYDSVLTEKSTGITYVTQLIFDSETKVYYVYYRWGETDYKLDGPHKTIESAKEAFQVTYKEKFDVEWKERETATSERWIYEVKTYETFEEVEEVEEIIEETEAEIIIAREKEIEVDHHTKITEETTTTVTEEVVTVEHETKKEIVVTEDEKESVKEVVVVKETGVVAKPAVSEKSSWFRRALGGASAIAAGVASGATHVATGALEKVDGVWKRTVKVLSIRKAHVDHVCPIAKTSYVYFDDEVYDSVLTEKSTGITYVTQLIYDSETKVYYVYYRWGETEYALDGPHETVESAKEAFQVSYKEKFDVEWKEREIATNDRWTYEVKTYETFEEVEEIEEVIEETEAEIIIAREKEIEVDNTKITEETTTTVTEEVVTVEHETTKETVVVEQETETVKEVIVEKETGEVAQPAVEKSTSWFRRALSGAEAAALGAGALVVGAGAVAVGVAAGATHGAGHAANGALEKVDGVWKRTVQVLTTRKAKVDHVCPLAKTAYVYYDDEVYDSVLTEKSTGITYVTQLIFDSETKVYYVYYRWGETDYKLDGPHETIESAKKAFQVNYKEKFDVEWTERETTVSEKWTYEVKTYETYEEIEEVEEIVEESEILTSIAREEQALTTGQKSITTTITTQEEEEVVVEQHESKDVEITDGEEIIKVVTTTKETGVVALPAVAKETSWFRRLASGAGEVASGALNKVDGVWKRSVQVITARKAHVDHICPIAKTSYVYFDEDVYDSVLIEKSTGMTYVTQLIFDSETRVYYVYVRWGETNYKLDGPHETIESAKEAFQVTYKEKFDVEWRERESVSEKWTYEVKTYETFEEVEEIEEIVEDVEVSELIAKEVVTVERDQTKTEHKITSSHDNGSVFTTTERSLVQESGSGGSAESISRAHLESVIRAEADAAAAAANRSSSTTVSVEETSKKTVFDLSTLPQLPDVGIEPNTGASVGVIDLRSGTAEHLRELPAHLRPRAWVSLHVGGWQDAPHELEGFMRLDDQSGQRLMEDARDAAQGKAQEASRIDNLRLPEIVAMFAEKLYGHFGEELPDELTLERLRALGPHRG